jgi:MOSC domain-containing protein YiiM
MPSVTAARPAAAPGDLWAYPLAHYAFWRTVRAQARVAAWDDALAPGALGEQLTVDGLTERDMWIGDRWLIGPPGGRARCVLAVREPFLPDTGFCSAVGFAQAAKLMLQSGFSGCRLGVIEPGQPQAGDRVVVEPGPRDVNVRELLRARTGRA